MESRDGEPPVIRFSVGAEPPPRRGGPRLTSAAPVPATMPAPARLLAPVPPWAVAVIAALAFALGIAVVKATSQSGSTPTAQSSDQSESATTRPPTVANPAAQAPATQAPAPPAAPAKTVVLTVSGDGIKETKTFTTGPDWSVTYSFDCSALGSQGNFAIYEDSGDVLANALAAKGGDTTYQHGDAGQHSLNVNSECAWTLKVTDGDSG